MDPRYSKWQLIIVEVFIKLIWLTLFLPWFYLNKGGGVEISTIVGYEYLLKRPGMLFLFLAIMGIHSIVYYKSTDERKIIQLTLSIALFAMTIEPFMVYGQELFSVFEFGYVVFFVLVLILLCVVAIPLTWEFIEKE
ncbi:MAG: hypothetical protein LBD38_04635 [Streptococcaceae bacterium]|jgi:hypothetical protein|nr:hypothetical protein [Streptococcaceae bacterium]